LVISGSILVVFFVGVIDVVNIDVAVVTVVVGEADVGVFFTGSCFVT
jgi:hypothetical protein